MQESSHGELPNSKGSNVPPNETLFVSSVEDLIKVALHMTDESLGVVKEALVRSEQLDTAMNQVAAIMSGTMDEQRAEAAFRWLHFCYLAITKNHIRKFLYIAKQEDLDDATQEAWASIWQFHNSFRAGEPFTPWMWTIVNRRNYDWLDRWLRKFAKLESIESHSNLVGESLGNEEHARRFALREAIQLLPLIYQTIIRMSYEEDQSLEQIAAALERPIAGVKTLKARALQKLRQSLSVKHKIPQGKTKSTRRGRINHADGF